MVHERADWKKQHYRELYVTKSDFLIDVDNLHCVYSTHKFHIRQVDSTFTVISEATRSYT
jgi:hypothetical protein